MFYFPCKPKTLAAASAYFDELDRNVGWVCEVKKNGWRMIVEKTGGEVVLWNRHKRVITDPLPEIRRHFKKTLPKGTILDGELLWTKRVKGQPESAYMFDIIMYKGELVTKLPLTERRKLLEKTVKETDKVQLSKWVRIGKKKLYQDIEAEDNDIAEGIVLKKLDSAYPISLSKSVENAHWLKVKKPEKHTRTRTARTGGD